MEAVQQYDVGQDRGTGKAKDSGMNIRQCLCQIFTKTIFVSLPSINREKRDVLQIYCSFGKMCIRDSFRSDCDVLCSCRQQNRFSGTNSQFIAFIVSDVYKRQQLGRVSRSLSCSVHSSGRNRHRKSVAGICH